MPHNEAIHIAVAPGLDSPGPCSDDSLVGAVLAGGASSRLGRDKALLRLDGDVDLLGRTVNLLRGLVKDVFVVGRTHPAYDCVPDLLPGRGPVGGIATALTRAAGAACLVLSCDLPFMSREALARLITAYSRRPFGATVCLYRRKADGRPENLTAIYGPETLPAFCRCMGQGLLKVGLVVPEEHKFYLDYDAAAAPGFFNLNRPADLAEARRIMAERGVEGALPPQTPPAGD